MKFRAKKIGGRLFALQVKSGLFWKYCYSDGTISFRRPFFGTVEFSIDRGILNMYSTQELNAFVAFRTSQIAKNWKVKRNVVLEDARNRNSDSGIIRKIHSEVFDL